MFAAVSFVCFNSSCRHYNLQSGLFIFSDSFSCSFFKKKYWEWFNLLAHPGACVVLWASKVDWPLLHLSVSQVASLRSPRHCGLPARITIDEQGGKHPTRHPTHWLFSLNQTASSIYQPLFLFQFLNFSSEEVKHPWSLGAGKNRETEDESMQLVKANINPDNPGCLTSNTLRATTQHFFACRLNPSMSNAIPLLFQFQFVKS